METERQRLARRFAELKAIRADGWESNWRDITDQILPYRGRWYSTDHNRGKKKNPKILNSTPTRSLRIMCAGLMAGITSPSRIWHRLTTKDKALREKHAIKSWLSAVEDIQRELLATGQWYQSLADGLYPDLGMLSVGAVWADEDPAGGLRFVPLTPGEYWLDVNAHGLVDTVYRERIWDVRKVVQEFGIGAVSVRTRDAYNGGKLAQPVTVCHAVYPNSDYNPDTIGPSGMAYASRWWEGDAPDEGNRFLRESGYYEFPVFAPRWRSLEGESYGRGAPGWEALPDCKGLQHRELTLARLIDKSESPPMKASAVLEDKHASLLPGDVTYLPDHAGGAMFEPAHTIDPQAIRIVKEDIAEIVQRIQQAFFVDLWLAILSDTRTQPATATEIDATRQEVMLQLGPLLENLNSGLLEPCILRVFGVAARQGQIPPPPPELEGSAESVQIEFISVMHQAQKLTAIVGIRELVGQIQQLAAAGLPQALDKIDADKIVDELATILGIRPEIVRTEEQVSQVRNAQAQRQQAQEQGQAMAVGARALKDASGADPQRLSELAQSMVPAAGGNWGAQV